jgi:hypothetical protein
VISSVESGTQPTGAAAIFLLQPTTGCGGNAPNCGDGNRANSPHTAGIMCGLGDGSVKFVAKGINPSTWWAAMTPRGGETLGSDW